MHDDILGQPGGYATLVSAQGNSLSSGQQQRLLLARALYTRPRFLILDEPTAHLDALTERAVVERLLELEATVIVVTHNPTVLALFPSLLKVDQGTVTRLRRC
nr:ATP-binding cassette domain-containing protein [Cupriavidus sp. D39]